MFLLFFVFFMDCFGLRGEREMSVLIEREMEDEDEDEVELKIEY